MKTAANTKAVSYTHLDVYKRQVPVRDGKVCLSGFENKVDTFIQRGIPSEQIALYVLEAVRKSVEAMLPSWTELPVVFSGGVSSNRMLRQYFEERYGGLFATPEFSCDNAAGIAVLSKLDHERQK